MTRVVVRMRSGAFIAYPVNESLCEHLARLAPHLDGPVEVSVAVSDR